MDSGWRVALSRKVSELSAEDLLEIAAQLGVENPNSTAGTAVKLEAKITRATSATDTGGTWVVEPTIDRLGSNTKYARIVDGSEAEQVVTPTSKYINLSVRAVPVEGSPKALNVIAGSGALSVLRYMPDPGNAGNPTLEGTDEVTGWDDVIDKSSVPFAGEGKSPVVVNSATLYELRKGEVIRGQGLLAVDLNSGESAPVETELIVAESKTATTGETVVPRTGDTVSTAQQVHTIFKEGTYVVPKAPNDGGVRYLNLVAYANRVPGKSGEELKVTNASVAFARSKPTSPFSADFEDGLLDQFYNFGHKDSITSNQAREGSKALQVDVDSTSWSETDKGQDPTESIRRAELTSPDRYAAGGFAGEDRWYGFSVYFPESFKVPSVGGSYFDGKLDEVRLYNQALTQAQVESDRDGKYGSGPTPVAAYSFNEDEGVIVHDTAGSHNGTIEGADWTASGKYGSALDFNGVKDLVRVADASELDLTKTFTLESWVNPESTRFVSPAISKTEGQNYSGYLLNGSTSFPGGAAYNAGKSAQAISSLELPVKTWSHLAVTSDGTNLSVYVNGELRKTVSAIEAAPTSADLMIGTSEYKPGTAGTWNIFSQLHHGDTGLDCATSLAPPISFNARYWKANGHTNPGESQTATPVDGNYLEVEFNGGEITSVNGGECNKIVKPTQAYVIAPLQRGQWYDFVLHTRWTTEEGGPGKSVSAVWMNGKQVLGNQTTPIHVPTLFWHGNPAVHNTEVGWSFGLYRGPSAEDPTTRHFLDSFRTGESYAQVAPKTHAPKIEVESYSAVLKGGGLNAFTTSKGAFSCKESGLQGTIGSASRQLALAAEYDKCTATASNYFSTVTMNSCHYNLGMKNAAPPYVGTLGVACEKGGDVIDYKYFTSSGGTLLCDAKIGPQAGLEGIALSNTGEGAKRGVGIAAEVKGVKYELNGGLSCSTPEVRTDGVISGAATLLGADEKGAQIGAWLAGEP